MDSKTKNIIWVIVAIVVVLFIISLFVKGPSYTANINDQNATTTVVDNDAILGTDKAGTKTNTGGSVTSSGINLEDNKVLATVISNAFIRVPQTGVDVTLTGGKATYSDSNGRVQGTVEVGKILGWAKTDSGYDVFTDMSLTKTGQVQVLHYVALFNVKTSTSVKYTSAVLIGDRLPIISAVPFVDPSKQTAGSVGTTVMNSSTGYIVTISYLDRKNGEPITATPTLAKSVNANVRNHIVTK